MQRLRRFARRVYEVLPRAWRFGYTYRQRRWGAGGERFYSGPGSDDAVSAAYVDYVTELIGRHGVRRVVDVGCGDFRVGRRLIAANPEVEYVGADIVPDLIRHHRRSWADPPRVTFTCLDAVADALPPGELVLIRQVLQHLSNSDIARVLPKLRAYRFALVTDAIAAGETPHPNEDIHSGFETRPRGLFLEEAPFHVAAECVLRTEHRAADGRLISEIRTLLLAN
jgi:SAM-dependent methyltransferase